jgi:hypothetical protein
MLNKFKKSVGITVGPESSQTAFFMLNKFKKSVGSYHKDSCKFLSMLLEMMFVLRFVVAVLTVVPGHVVVVDS